MLGNPNKTKQINNDLEKPLQIHIPQNEVKLPNIDYDEDEFNDEDSHLLYIKELTEVQHIWMNLFKIENVIQTP